MSAKGYTYTRVFCAYSLAIESNRSRLPIGASLAQYEIRALLGEGGMGEVYLATDARLRRPVALKVLKAEEQGSEALDRLLVEARAASALNHPNVAHIYEIGQLGDVVYIGMEYVEGETLEWRLRKAPLPVAEIVAVAVQIADALAEAFAQGIVHRDLKPANIVFNQRGQAKILDFGIAKITRAEEPVISAKTEPNMVLGTVPYMSPEQARGKGVDHRSDLFSFGVILFEMVTGTRPFDGESVMDTFHRITVEPPPPIVRDDVPEELRRVIARCLEKDRENRYPSAVEVLRVLRGLEPAAVTQTIAPPPRRRGWMALLAGVALVALAAMLLLRPWRTASSPAPRLTKITTAPGLEDEPALSPDGNTVAYTSDERGNLDIFVRPLAGGEAVRLTDSAADDAQPAWSPDGSRLAFVSARERSGRLSIVLGQALSNFVNAQGGDLFVVPAAGGAAEKLVDGAFYPAWSPDGQWIAFQSSRGGRWDLWKVPSNGGTPLQLTNDAHFDYQPSWSPDGKSIVYGSGMPEPYRMKVVPSSGGTPRAITDGTDRVLLKPVFAAGGDSVLYSSMRGGSLNLWRTPVRTGRPPERLTLGEGDDVNPVVGAGGKRIIYATVRQTPDLWTLDVTTGKAEQVTFDTGREEFPHRTRDGMLVFSSDRSGTEALWFRDGNGGMKQFVARADAGQPRWSPDGTHVAYRFSDKGKTWVGIQAPGSAELRIVAREAESPSWSPDGAQLAYTSWDRNPKSQIYVAAVDGKTPPRQVTDLRLTTSYATWSPDGRFLSFQATRDDGTRHIWIVEIATGRARPLTSGASEDSHPHWSPVDPDKILFVRNHENLMTVSVSTGRIEPLTRYAEPNMVLDYPSWSPDGTKVDFSIARKRGDLYLLEMAGGE